MTKTEDTAKERTCCVAGHHDIQAGDVEYVKTELHRRIDEAIADGYHCFLSDFTDGANQLFAQAVLEKRSENDAICLEAVLPWRSRYDELMNDEARKPLLLACADVLFTGENKTAKSERANRKEQLRRSSRMVIVYDGREGGGTFEAIRMGHDERITIREIPLGL